MRMKWFSLMLIPILMFSAGCGGIGALYEECDAEILSMLKTPLPASAQVSSESCVPGFAPGNAQYKATFTLAPADLEAFQSSTRITDWGNSVGDNPVYEAEAGPLTSLIYGDHTDGAFMEEALIDTSNPDLYTVYYFNAFID